MGKDGDFNNISYFLQTGPEDQPTGDTTEALLGMIGDRLQAIALLMMSSQGITRDELEAAVDRVNADRFERYGTHPDQTEEELSAALGALGLPRH